MTPSFRIRICLPVAVGLACTGASRNSRAEFACAQTPELALHITQSSTATTTPLSRDGYRITAVRWDPLLNQRWAMVASCAHPEQPLLAMRLPDSRIPSTFSSTGSHSTQTPFPVVHAGDLVQMWSQEENLRIEASGRAQETGTTGSVVHVRLLHSGFDPGQEQTLIGIVRGPGDVEIRR